MAWVQPSLVSHCAHSSMHAIWTGIGGYKNGSQALVQAGFDATTGPYGGTGPINDSVAWWELLPAGPVFNPSVHLVSGQTASSTVSANATNALFSVVNWSTGVVWNAGTAVGPGQYDGTSAEVVDELIYGNGPGGFPWEFRRTTNPTISTPTFNNGTTFASAGALVDNVNLTRGSGFIGVGFFNSGSNQASETWQKCI